MYNERRTRNTRRPSCEIPAIKSHRCDLIGGENKKPRLTLVGCAARAAHTLGSSPGRAHSSKHEETPASSSANSSGGPKTIRHRPCRLRLYHFHTDSEQSTTRAVSIIRKETKGTMQPPHTPDERRAKLEAVKELARKQEHDAAQEALSLIHISEPTRPY